MVGICRGGGSGRQVENRVALGVRTAGRDAAAPSAPAASDAAASPMRVPCGCPFRTHEDIAGMAVAQRKSGVGDEVRQAVGAAQQALQHADEPGAAEVSAAAASQQPRPALPCALFRRMPGGSSGQPKAPPPVPGHAAARHSAAKDRSLPAFRSCRSGARSSQWWPGWPGRGRSRPRTAGKRGRGRRRSGGEVRRGRAASEPAFKRVLDVETWLDAAAAIAPRRLLHAPLFFCARPPLLGHAVPTTAAPPRARLSK